MDPVCIDVVRVLLMSGAENNTSNIICKWTIHTRISNRLYKSLLYYPRIHLSRVHKENSIVFRLNCEYIYMYLDGRMMGLLAIHQRCRGYTNMEGCSGSGSCQSSCPAGRCGRGWRWGCGPAGPQTAGWTLCLHLCAVPSRRQRTLLAARQQ